MSASPIGRMRFFWLSVLLVIAELIVLSTAVSVTTGWSVLLDPPGPGREGLALTAFVITSLFAIGKANLALSRSADARGPKWLVWTYIGFTVIFMILQSLTLLVTNFANGEQGSAGLNLLGLGLMGMWFAILFAPPNTEQFDPDAFLEAEGYGQTPPRGMDMSVTQSPARKDAALMPATSRSSVKAAAPQIGGKPRSSGFGKRGLA